jgi:hypothetical protein
MYLSSLWNLACLVPWFLLLIRFSRFCHSQGGRRQEHRKACPTLQQTTNNHKRQNDRSVCWLWQPRLFCDIRNKIDGSLSHCGLNLAATSAETEDAPAKLAEPNGTIETCLTWITGCAAAVTLPTSACYHCRCPQVILHLGNHAAA